MVTEPGTLPRPLDMRSIILAQLPRLLQTRVSITRIETDAYHLGGRVFFSDGGTREWNVRLEPTMIDGVPVACALPAWFIDHLCASA